MKKRNKLKKEIRDLYIILYGAIAVGSGLACFYYSGYLAFAFDLVNGSYLKGLLLPFILAGVFSVDYGFNIWLDRKKILKELKK
jgi:hypothetical protein